MAELDSYKEKRNFSKTAEPAGGEPKSEKLLFVVQKHDATNLHYDLRLEVKGVFKSWAVPRGPSMYPNERRLAIPVEDHPYDYKDFEGLIPKGQYGGGTVIIWDEGWYEPVEKLKTKKEREHWMMSNYYRNALEIVMHGHKLKGKFILIKFRDDKYENSWRMIKAEDEYASTKDILLKDKSVISKLTIEQMAKKNGAAVWESNRSSHREAAPEPAHPGVAAPMPARPEPMLCTLIDTPFTDSDWLYEVKFDGYRVIAAKENSHVKLHSRGGKDYTKKFTELRDELAGIDGDFVVDGEVVVLNDKGHPDFDALQNYKPGDRLAYYVFDILWLNGYNLQELRLEERRTQLQGMLPEGDVILYSRDFNDGKALFGAIQAQGLEGIVCKRRDSRYRQGKRGQDWLKLHTELIQDFVIGAWTESETANAFRSIIFGNYVNGRFTYVGHVGGGFKDKERPAILRKLRKLEIKENPFEKKVETDTRPHWIKPELVITVKFATWTKGGAIRKPATFIGFRDDKKPEQVTAEVPLRPAEETDAIVSEEKPEAEETSKVKLSPLSNWPKVLNRKVNTQHDFPIGEHIVTLTNMEEEPWPGVRKADLITYYHRVSPFILPYLQARPLSLHIKDSHPMEPGFYIKDMEGQQPGYVDIFRDKRKIPKRGKRDLIDYGICNNEAALLYFINLGCIDMNPWSARAASPAQPDYISLDLDSTTDDFSQIILAAQATKAVLDALKLKCVVKTSGKRGLHIFVPCSGFSNPQAKALGKTIYGMVDKEIPGKVTDIFSKDQRNGRVFFDYTLNDYADTMASVYSVRPYHVPSVSTPLEWKEVNDELHPADFTIHNVIERIENKGDLFAKLLDEKYRTANHKTLRKLLKA